MSATERIISRKDVDLERNQLMRRKFNVVLEETGTQTAFIAEKAGMNRFSMYSWKNDKRNFITPNLDKIENVLITLFPKVYRKAK